MLEKLFLWCVMCCWLCIKSFKLQKGLYCPWFQYHTQYSFVDVLLPMISWWFTYFCATIIPAIRFPKGFCLFFGQSSNETILICPTFCKILFAFTLIPLNYKQNAYCFFCSYYHEQCVCTNSVCFNLSLYLMTWNHTWFLSSKKVMMLLHYKALFNYCCHYLLLGTASGSPVSTPIRVSLLASPPQ